MLSMLNVRPACFATGDLFRRMPFSTNATRTKPHSPELTQRTGVHRDDAILVLDLPNGDVDLSRFFNTRLLAP